MKSVLFLLLVIFPEPFLADSHNGRLMMMDKHMRRLNLTDIHFTDPGGFVKVDTVINQYSASKEDLIERLKQKVNETAYFMVNSKPQQVAEWNKRVVKLPRPRLSGKVIKKGGGGTKG